MLKLKLAQETGMAEFLLHGRTFQLLHLLQPSVYKFKNDRRVKALFKNWTTSHWWRTSSPCPSFLDVEPGKDVDYAHHHVKHNLFPLADAEVCLTVDNPKGHDAPVQDDEDAKVELKYRRKQSKGDNSGCYGEEVPTELDNHCQIADGLLVIPRLSQGLLIGGQGPGHRDEGGCSCHS